MKQIYVCLSLLNDQSICLMFKLGSHSLIYCHTAYVEVPAGLPLLVILATKQTEEAHHGLLDGGAVLPDRAVTLSAWCYSLRNVPIRHQKSVSPHLHDDTHEQLVDVMAQARPGPRPGHSPPRGAPVWCEQGPACYLPGYRTWQRGGWAGVSGKIAPTCRNMSWKIYIMSKPGSNLRKHVNVVVFALLSSSLAEVFGCLVPHKTR